MSFEHSHDASAHGAQGAPASARPAPGKSALTQHLPASKAAAPAPGAQLGGGKAGKAGKVDVDEAYGLHLQVTKVAPILEAIRDDARVVRSRLIGGVDRVVVIDAAADLLEPQLEVAQRIIADSEAAEPHDVLVALVEAASREILWIRRWLASRQATRAQIELFQRRVVRRTDALRAAVGLGATGAMPAPDLEENETEEAEREDRKVGLAVADFHGALGELAAGAESGIERFLKFATFKRPAPPPSFWAELGKAALVALGGNILGSLGGALVNRVLMIGGGTEAFKKSVATISNVMGGSITDTAESAAGEALEEPTVSSANQVERDRQLFAEGVRKLQAAYNANAKHAVDAAVSDQRISAEVIRALSASVSGLKAQVTDITYRTAAHGFALFQAQQGLGTTEGADGKRSTDQGDYTGVMEERDMGPLKNVPVKVRDKRGTTGVGRFKVGIAIVDGKTRLEVRAFRINGANDDMAIAVLERAGLRMNKVGLPLEIDVEPFGFGKYIKHPMLIVDEAGELQDALDWSSIEIVRPRDDGPEPQGAEIHASPESLWKALRDMPLPKDTARIAKGG